jgi:hypothetical protein
VTNLWACFVFVSTDSFARLVFLDLYLPESKGRMKNRFSRSLLVVLSSSYAQSNAIHTLPENLRPQKISLCVLSSAVTQEFFIDFTLKRHVRFEVIIAMIMKSTVLWDVTPCSLVNVKWHFAGSWHLHLHSIKWGLAGKKLVIYKMGKRKSY